MKYGCMDEMYVLLSSPIFQAESQDSLSQATLSILETHCA